MSMFSPKTWVITEGIAGTENQCLGVTQALMLNPDIKRISLAEPWNTLSPFLSLENKNSFTPHLEPPWPDLLIASGRKSIAACRYIKRKSKNKTFIVYLQDPRVPPSFCNLVALPQHDPTRGKNVITTIGAPNKITQSLLKEAQENFRALGALSSPKVAILLGGKSKAYTFSADQVRKLCMQLKSLQASLMISTSRRTGKDNEDIIRSELGSLDNVVFWDGSQAQTSHLKNAQASQQKPDIFFKENPYLGFLAWADFIIVSPDSASMLCEACSTGKPVYMLDIPGGSSRIKKLHSNLISHGALRKFEGILESWTYTPLQDAQTVAKYIRDHMIS